jgi:hypothetical protein
VPPLIRAGRVASPPDTVVLAIETVEGTEHLVVNLRQGSNQTVRLADGRTLSTDGLAVRVKAQGLVLAGGTHAKLGDHVLRQSPSYGTIRSAVRHPSSGAQGWFDTGERLADPETLSGRVLLITHGDGSTRGWTITSAVNTPEGRARLFVREEPGFSIDAATHQAHYYQFPRESYPGPHRFRVSKLTR